MPIKDGKLYTNDGVELGTPREQANLLNEGRGIYGGEYYKWMVYALYDGYRRMAALVDLSRADMHLNHNREITVEELIWNIHLNVELMEKAIRENPELYENWYLEEEPDNDGHKLWIEGRRKNLERVLAGEPDPIFKHSFEPFKPKQEEDTNEST